MGKQLHVDGEDVNVDDDTTISQLKDAVGAAASDIATYRDEDSGDMKALSDRDTVEEVPNGSTVSFQPAEGEIFG